MYNVGNKNLYPDLDNGIRSLTEKLTDDGKFKIPSLRNVALTAPYLHDGSTNTLNEIIDQYARGGRLITTGPNAGDGSLNKCKDNRIKGFMLSPKEKQDLINFLFSLTDSSVLTNPDFQNPFNP